MAFPTTGVLDNFDRANANPLDGNWTNEAVNQMQLVSFAAASAAASGTFTSAEYNVSTYGPDCEVFITVPTKPTTADQAIFIGLRQADFNVAADNYTMFVFAKAGTDEWQIHRFINGSNVQLGAAFSQELTDGDSIGFSAVSDVLTAYYKPSAGSWSALTTRTDSTHSSAGKIYMGTNSAVARIDDFGGGTVVVAAANTLMGQIML